MYEGSGLDYGDAYEYGELELDEGMYIEGEYYNDVDDEYARDSYDLDALAYKHYAWYNTHTYAQGAMIAQKRHVRVVLDLQVYDDLDIESIDWKELLELEGSESVEVIIKDQDFFYWSCATFQTVHWVLTCLENRDIVPVLSHHSNANCQSSSREEH